MLRSIPCLFSSVLHFNLPSMITASQLLLSISCFKCIVLLLGIFNNYPRLWSYHSQIEPQELYFTGHRHFYAIHIQLVIDNAGYIYYDEAWILGLQLAINGHC
jgi:hypothetical protein